jgi:hypothetical protein
MKIVYTHTYNYDANVLRDTELRFVWNDTDTACCRYITRRVMMVMVQTMLMVRGWRRYRWRRKRPASGRRLLHKFTIKLTMMMVSHYHYVIRPHVGTELTTSAGLTGTEQSVESRRVATQPSPPRTEQKLPGTARHQPSASVTCRPRSQNAKTYWRRSTVGKATTDIAEVSVLISPTK